MGDLGRYKVQLTLPGGGMGSKGEGRNHDDKMSRLKQLTTPWEESRSYYQRARKTDEGKGGMSFNQLAILSTNYHHQVEKHYCVYQDEGESKNDQQMEENQGEEKKEQQVDALFSNTTIPSSSSLVVNKGGRKRRCNCSIFQFHTLYLYLRACGTSRSPPLAMPNIEKIATEPIDNDYNMIGIRLSREKEESLEVKNIVNQMKEFQENFEFEGILVGRSGGWCAGHLYHLISTIIHHLFEYHKQQPYLETMTTTGGGQSGFQNNMVVESDESRTSKRRRTTPLEDEMKQEEERQESKEENIIQQQKSDSKVSKSKKDGSRDMRGLEWNSFSGLSQIELSHVLSNIQPQCLLCFHKLVQLALFPTSFPNQDGKEEGDNGVSRTLIPSDLLQVSKIRNLLSDELSLDLPSFLLEVMYILISLSLPSSVLDSLILSCGIVVIESLMKLEGGSIEEVNLDESLSNNNSSQVSNNTTQFSSFPATLTPSSSSLYVSTSPLSPLSQLLKIVLLVQMWLSSVNERQIEENKENSTFFGIDVEGDDCGNNNNSEFNSLLQELESESYRILNLQGGNIDLIHQYEDSLTKFLILFSSDQRSEDQEEEEESTNEFSISSIPWFDIRL